MLVYQQKLAFLCCFEEDSLLGRMTVVDKIEPKGTEKEMSLLSLQ